MTLIASPGGNAGYSTMACGARADSFTCDYSDIKNEEPYRGCYMSVNASMPTAILTYHEMTIQFCVELCRTVGSPQLSALKVDRCICIEETTLEMEFVQMPESFCNNFCSGNPLQKCGSRNGFISVYNTTLYDPLHLDTCLDYFKVGMVPKTDSCVRLQIGKDTAECCWNSLLRQDQVNHSVILFHINLQTFNFS